jgi:leucyl aminopeptidase
MKNTGGRYGGAITAALLLEEFIDGLPWIHLDIAGPARSSDTDLVTGKGATGFGVMGLFNFIKVISQSSVVEETIS